MVFSDAQQPTGGHWLIGSLNVDHLRFTEHHRALDQSCGGRAEHHPTSRSGRLHPLSHPDLLTDGGVSERPTTDFTSDHQAGVKSHPELQINAVALTDVGRKSLRLLLNA